MSYTTITKQQTNLLKGVGILLIVFHNYFHWIVPFTGENEFVFNVTYTQNFLEALTSSVAEIPNTILSFFGHYGVQLFIFISGYGLTKSYLKKEKGYFTFIKQRASKIYPAFTIAIVVLLLYTFLVYATIPDASWFAKIGLKLAMLHTLLPRQALSINGPWWFYGLIFQLYVVFIPLFLILKKWGWKGFFAVLAVSYSIIFILYNPLLQHDVYILANAPGHIPEFTLGIALALFPEFKLKSLGVLLSITILVLGNFYFPVFPFTFIAATYLLLWCTLKVIKKETLISKFVVFYGELSMFLFAIHGFFRKPYFVDTALTTDSAWEKIAIGFLYLLTVTLVAFVCKELYRRATIAIASRKKV